MHAEIEDVAEGARVGVAGAGTVVYEVDYAAVCGAEEGVVGSGRCSGLAGRFVGGLVWGCWGGWWCWWRRRRRLELGLGLGLEARVHWHRHGVSGKVTGIETWHGHGNDSWKDGKGWVIGWIIYIGKGCVSY